MFGYGGMGCASTRHRVAAPHITASVAPFNAKARALIFVCLALVSLSACGGTAKPGVTTQVEPLPAAETSDATEQKQATSTPAGPATPEVARRALVPVEQMSGLTAEQITEMLGKPQFQRQDNTAELWQYRGESCVLHLFLYRAKDEWRVRHAEGTAARRIGRGPDG